jgi:hypothetical protein
MKRDQIEKRRHPRVDTSKDDLWNIRILGFKGKPLTGKIINISLGGVAFVSSYKNVAKAMKKFSRKVKIQLPDGVLVDANTTLLRVRPVPASDDCVCVLKLTEMNGNSSSRLARFIST